MGLREFDAATRTLYVSAVEFQELDTLRALGKLQEWLERMEPYHGLGPINFVVRDNDGTT